MLRRIGLFVVVLALLLAGRVASADIVTAVDDDYWDYSLDLDGTGDLDGVTFSWDISPDDVNNPDIWTYTYTWPDDVALTEWVLEVSPNKTAASFQFGSGYTAVVGSRDDLSKDSTTVDLDNAITFTPDEGTSSYTFYTRLNPVYGDVWVTDDTDVAYNPSIGQGVGAQGQETLVTLFVPIPDSGWGGGDILIPEPSLSVLALLGLLTGGFARWRRKKEA